MEEKLKIGERDHTLGVRELEPGRLRLEVDGTGAEVRVVASSGGRHLVELGGTLETIFTSPSDEGTWVWHRGRARLVTEQASGSRLQASAEASSEDRGRRSGSAAGTAAAVRRAPLPPGSITPPMPATVVAVLVEEGRLVERGEPLLVLSAMKTETQLLAPAAGRVTAVKARVGAKVRPGEVLVQLQPEGDRHGR
jgi:biotin carboxyl carrier protein